MRPSFSRMGHCVSLRRSRFRRSGFASLAARERYTTKESGTPRSCANTTPSAGIGAASTICCPCEFKPPLPASLPGSVPVAPSLVCESLLALLLLPAKAMPPPPPAPPPAPPAPPTPPPPPPSIDRFCCDDEGVFFGFKTDIEERLKESEACEEEEGRDDEMGRYCLVDDD